MYFDYPLEQGLRRIISTQEHYHVAMYFDYPLEQGLRQLASSPKKQEICCILIIH